mgnify:CR=1 FL=1
MDVVVDNGEVWFGTDFGDNQCSVSHRKTHKFVRVTSQNDYQK